MTTVPISGNVRDATLGDVLLWDKAKAAALFASIRDDKPLVSPKPAKSVTVAPGTIKVKVLNGTDVQGLGATAASRPRQGRVLRDRDPGQRAGDGRRHYRDPLRHRLERVGQDARRRHCPARSSCPSRASGRSSRSASARATPVSSRSRSSRHRRRPAPRSLAPPPTTSAADLDQPSYAARVAILIDPPKWWLRERWWGHMVSDVSYDELHSFAEGLGVPRRGFERDHYDIPEHLHPVAIAAGRRARDLARARGAPHRGGAPATEERSARVRRLIRRAAPASRRGAARAAAGR